MKIFAIFGRVQSKYGKQIGRTAKDGTKVFKKNAGYYTEINAVGSEGNIKKKVFLSPGSYRIEKPMVSDGNTTKSLVKTINVSENKRVIDRDVLYQTKTVDARGGSYYTDEWVSQSKMAINEKGNTYTVLTQAQKPSGEMGEKSELLTYPRGELASSAWWSWLINNKPVESVKFYRSLTPDIKNEFIN